MIDRNTQLSLSSTRRHQPKPRQQGPGRIGRPFLRTIDEIDKHIARRGACGARFQARANRRGTAFSPAPGTFGQASSITRIPS